MNFCAKFHAGISELFLDDFFPSLISYIEDSVLIAWTLEGDVLNQLVFLSTSVNEVAVNYFSLGKKAFLERGTVLNKPHSRLILYLCYK